MKQQDASTNKTNFVVKSAHLKTSNKQRTTILELVPVEGVGQPPEQCLLFPSESEPDIKPWFFVIDHALKHSITENEKSPEPSLSEAINETLSTVSAVAGKSLCNILVLLGLVPVNAKLLDL